MADWFASVPHSFDVIAYTARVSCTQSSIPHTLMVILAVPIQSSCFARTLLQGQMFASANGNRKDEGGRAECCQIEEVRPVISAL